MYLTEKEIRLDRKIRKALQTGASATKISENHTTRVLLVIQDQTNMSLT